MLKILSVVRRILLDDTAVSGRVARRVNITKDPVDMQRPNITLVAVSGSDEVNHQNSDGLYQHLIRVYSKGEDAEQASGLQEDVLTALKIRDVPIILGVNIRLSELVNQNGDYDEKAKVYRGIDDFRVTWRYNS